MVDNLSLQIDEIEALSAIYDKQMEVEDPVSRSYLFRIITNPLYTFNLYAVLPSTYPTSSPPKYELRAPWLQAKERIYLQENLDRIYNEACGESILFTWIEFIKEFVESKINLNVKESDQHEKLPVVSECASSLQVPALVHGEPFTDRRSTFQAHLAVVDSAAKIAAVRAKLLENRKVSSATHNIMAYRVRNQETGTYAQDCDDDGETAAGKRLLHLLQILDASDVVVFVSRWYGGIHLGPDRFKHINNVARSLLVQQGFATSKVKKK